MNQRLLPKESFAQFASAASLIGEGLRIVLPLLLGYCLDLSGHNYRLTYYAGSALSLAALGCYVVLYRSWVANSYGSPVAVALQGSRQRTPPVL